MMAEQNIENFWNMCEDKLKHYATLFNDDMGSKGFKVEYKVVDKTPMSMLYPHCYIHWVGSVKYTPLVTRFITV